MSLAEASAASLVALLTLTLMSCAAQPLPSSAPERARASLEVITFDDLKPAGSMLKECWGGIGLDSAGWVYAAFSDFGPGRLDDTVIFRWHTESGERERLGTLRGISAAAGNAMPDESFAKVHVAFLEHDGKMYFASHDFHDIERDYSDMNEHRGGHFYAFDLETETFEDLSRHDPGGVSAAHQGIIATDILRAHDKLAGFTFPLGYVLVYDLKSRRTTRYPGVAQYKFKNVTRYIIATRRGKIFFAYQANDFWLYELDIATGEMRQTTNENIVRRGGMTATVTTRDERYVYLTDLSGRLYRFDVDKERLRELGWVLSEHERARGLEVRRLGTIALSNDETTLYTVPYGFRDGTPPALYAFDISSGVSRKLFTLSAYPNATVKGAGVTDARGRLVFCMHEKDNTDARLLRLTPISAID